MNNEEMISYYELLTMIKDYENEKQYPKVYWHNNTREKVLYIPTFDCVNGQLEGYHIKNRNLESEDIRYWLSECMLESSMFDKCLEIKKKKEKTELQQEISKLQSEIDLLSNEIGHYHNIIHSMRDRNNYMKETLKDLLEIANELESKSE